jgi:DNA-binding response OmpR family regulator
MRKILLVEDDRMINESLQEFLQEEGFSVDCAFNAEEAYEKTFNNQYDLYILDINLPGEDSGFDILKHLKDSGDETPTIYISALTDTDSVLKGFDTGADDYIKKPFDPIELAVRIKKRYLNKPKQNIQYQDLEFDLKTREVYTKDGELIPLGDVSKNILYLLIQNRGKVVSLDELIEYVNENSRNALRVHIAKLKKRLGIKIKNIRGKGYILEEV